MALTPDENGFAEFVAARGTALQRTSYLLVGDHHTAQDLVQTALMQAARHWERIHTSPEAYVRRSIFTANISRWRRQRLGEVLAGDALPEGSGQPPDDIDARATVMSALATLTSKQRAVLVLRYYEDLTETQTAEALGISTSTVKSTHRQALARLRDRAPELATVLGRTL